MILFCLYNIIYKLGNKKANDIFEETISTAPDVKRPTKDSMRELRTMFIRRKYEFREFTKPYSGNSTPEQVIIYLLS